MKCSLCHKEGHKRNNNRFHPNYIYTKNRKKKNTITALKNENSFISKFNTDSEYKTYMLTNLNIPLEQGCVAKKPNKNQGFNLKHTSNWINFKIGSKEKYPSPKTDVILKFGNKVITISLKSGRGRVTSADFYETNAIFKTVLNSSIYKDENMKKIKKYVKDITTSFLTIKLQNSRLNKTEMDRLFINESDKKKYDYEYIWYLQFIDSVSRCNKFWKELKYEYPEFCDDIVIECLRGNNKFSDNIGRADFLVCLEDSSSTNVSNIIDLSKKTPELINYCREVIRNNRNPFAAKSSGKTIWMRFF